MTAHYHSPVSTVSLLPSFVFFTRICWGIFSINSSLWLIMPTSLLVPDRLISISIALSMDFRSSVPKPSSRAFSAAVRDLLSFSRAFCCLVFSPIRYHFIQNYLIIFQRDHSYAFQRDYRNFHEERYNDRSYLRILIPYGCPFPFFYK